METSFWMRGMAEAGGASRSVDDLDWNPHPAFYGVALKHLMDQNGTGGSLSLHLVRVDPGCTLEPHTHPEQDELHLVLEGAGQGLLENSALDYRPGTARFLPKGQEHSVRAGEGGLLLAALFTPAGR